MAFAPMFTIEPMYQLRISNLTSGVGIVVMDSLNNARVQLGIGYLFMRGKPTISFDDGIGDRKLQLEQFGHEALGALNVTVVKQWLAVAVKPKYQYTSLRYRDDNGIARDAHRKLNAFGLDMGITANLAGWAAIAVTGTNLTGNIGPAYTDERAPVLTNVGYTPGTPVNYRSLSGLSDYPLGVGYGVSVFPLHKLGFNLNFDGFHDFSTYRFEKHDRMLLGGSAEFVAGPVPIRFATTFDNRGRGQQDDRVFVSGGIGYVKPAAVGGVGVDVGFGFSQQVTGPQKDTVIGFNLGLRINPDL
ncbi:MAG: hypothetical protein IAG13_22690 [Deltaproteobacteria bacterium]|nr:hypothetical protein [Nannocystaceae bacterium]